MVGPPRDRVHAAKVEGRKMTRDESKMGGTQSQPSHTKAHKKTMPKLIGRHEILFSPSTASRYARGEGQKPLAQTPSS